VSFEESLLAGPAAKERPLPIDRVDSSKRSNLAGRKVRFGDQLEIVHSTDRFYIYAQIGIETEREQREPFGVRQVEPQPTRPRRPRIGKLGLAVFVYGEGDVFGSNFGTGAKNQAHPPVIDDETMREMRKAKSRGAIALFCAEQA